MKFSKLKEIAKLIFSPITLSFSYLIPKDSNKWVFGAWFGKSYTDNPRYLFEYLRADKSIKKIWITSNKDVLLQVRSNGDLAFHKYSVIGIYHSITAGVAFFTCGPTDINELFIIRTKKIQFWHGVPLKKIIYDDCIRYPNTQVGILKKARDILIRSLLASRNQRWDYIVSSSPIVTNRFISAFLHDKSKILEIGYPRQDKLLEESITKKNETVILFAPTHRQEGKGSFSSINYFDKADLNYLDSTLQGKETKLVIKLHPYHDPSPVSELISPYKNILLDTTSDTYDLLKIADILITDYSSIYIDYLILGRPVIFFCFDLHDYISNERGLYEDYQSSVPGPVVTTWPELQELIFRIDKTPSPEILEARNKYFSFTDGKARERMIKFLKNGNQK